MSIDPSVPLSMTRDIVIAEISNNPVPPESLPRLIQQVYETVCRIAADTAARHAGTQDDAAGEELVAPIAASMPSALPSLLPSEGRAGRPASGNVVETTLPTPAEGFKARTAREEGRAPAVPRDKSVFPDHICCLFDGVKRKMLKRHIRNRYGMSPEAYRQYWELPDDYPMVAPAYSNEKREYAILTEFGKPRGKRRRSGGTQAA